MIKMKELNDLKNEINFDEIYGFKTSDYVGLWNWNKETFGLMPINDIDFSYVDLKPCSNLEELNKEVFAICEQEIETIYGECEFTIMVEDFDLFACLSESDNI